MKIAIFLAGFLVVSISAATVCLQLSYLLHITELKLDLKFIGLHYNRFTTYIKHFFDKLM